MCQNILQTRVTPKINVATALSNYERFKYPQEIFRDFKQRIVQFKIEITLTN